MNYYKVICGNQFIGVGCTYDLRRFQRKHNVMLMSDEDNAQYIQIGEELYRDEWLLPATQGISFTAATVRVITQEEYNQLYQAIEDGGEVDVTDTEQETTPVAPDPVEEITLAYAKEKKIAEMSSTCNATIVRGVDVALSGNEVKHFSLTVEDQLNLISLQSMASSGNFLIPYHADGEECMYYTLEDFTAIVNAATTWKMYHESYFNNLKSWINRLESVADVGAIYYGISIPDEFLTDVMRDIINS